MLIFDAEAHPIVVDSIYSPVLTDHFWVLDLEMQDYTLATLNVLEEVVCPTAVLQVEGFSFAAPASWYILVFDTETTQLDSIQLADAGGREFCAMVYGPDMSRPRGSIIQVVDYAVSHKNTSPSLLKHHMLCHPIGPSSWVNISPVDLYSKYLKDASVGNLVNF